MAFDTTASLSWVPGVFLCLLKRSEIWCPLKSHHSFFFLTWQVFSELGDTRAQIIPTSELYDICLVQTDLLEAIADMNYFYRCIRRCEENYEGFLASAGGHV